MSRAFGILALAALLLAGGCTGSPRPARQVIVEYMAPSAPEVVGPDQVRVGVASTFTLRAIDPQGWPIAYRTRTANATIQGDRMALVVPTPGVVDLEVWAENDRHALSATTTRRITAVAGGSAD